LRIFQINFQQNVIKINKIIIYASRSNVRNETAIDSALTIHHYIRDNSTYLWTKCKYIYYC